jgi:hypothetical protein
MIFAFGQPAANDKDVAAICRIKERATNALSR